MTWKKQWLGSLFRRMTVRALGFASMLGGAAMFVLGTNWPNVGTALGGGGQWPLSKHVDATGWLGVVLGCCGTALFLIPSGIYMDKLPELCQLKRKYDRNKISGADYLVMRARVLERPHQETIRLFLESVEQSFPGSVPEKIRTKLLAAAEVESPERLVGELEIVIRPQGLTRRPDTDASAR